MTSNPLCFKIAHFHCFHSFHENCMLHCQNKENTLVYVKCVLFLKSKHLEKNIKRLDCHIELFGFLLPLCGIFFFFPEMDFFNSELLKF